MKKTILLFTVTLLAITSIFAQTPNQFKYQAVLRDAGGEILSSENVTVDISILQGSASGTSVFDETHNVTTTAQGLINLNIGSVSDLSVVDFSTDTYFIEITVDGTLMGTSQLLSVPYALQAKTAENVFSGNYNDLTNTPTLFDGAWSSLTGTPPNVSIFNNDAGYLTDFTETDPVFTAWDKDYADLTNKPANATTTTAGFMSSADKTKLDGLTNADGSETSVTAGTNVTVTGTGTSGDPYIVNATSGSSYYVGQLIGTNGEDGVVFYVDETGQHGLICSKTDIDGGSGVAWSNVSSTEIGATAKSEFNGSTNTTAITGQAGHTSSAAKLCADYSTTGTSAGDWYLPSIDELIQIYHSKYQINKALNTNSFASTNFWSSTEYNSNSAWNYYFFNGYSANFNKGNTYRVRAVRAF